MNTSSRRFLILLLIWGVAAAMAGAFHLLVQLPPVIVPLLVASLSVGLSLAVARVRRVREAVENIGVRFILAAHLIRFVGIYFLWLYAQGRIPAEFAHRAGWGDIIAAAGALGLLFWPEGAGFRRPLFWWNIVGAADLLVAVGTAGWLNTTRPGSMIEIAGFPLTLVPLWIVPILLSSHLYLLRKHICGERSITPTSLNAGTYAT